MRVTAPLLVSAYCLLAACSPEREVAANNDVENNAAITNAGNEAQANAAAMPDPSECKIKDGVSSGPYCGFEAVANLFPPVKQPSLTVSGDYWLNKRTGNVVLTAAVPQGINPKILLVNLTIEGSGGGGDWAKASGKFTATADQYESVEIVDPSGSRIVIPVEETH